jgi:predicted transposase YbfD/YdcC
MVEKGKNTSKHGKPNVVKQQYNKKKIASVAVHFLRVVEQLDDPRTGSCDYPLGEILFVAIIAVLCGSESDQDIATFGEAQIKWFRQFMPLKNGIPSHDTFRRIFMLLKPEVLQSAYDEIFRELRVRKRGKNSPPKHYAIDGKVSRGCYNTKGKSLLHTVSCWDRANGISLGQLATKNEEGKEVGEFNTIPKLIKELDIKGALITIDAGGCYAEITDAIIDGDGSYAITLKENQPTLHGMAKDVFAKHEQNGFLGVATYQETNRGHGRVEERTYYAVPVPKADGRLEKWSGLETLVMGHFRRSVKGGQETEFIRFYISSVPCKKVEWLGQSLRGHWAIENGLHWVLDVSFGEDGNRTRRGNGAENWSILRRMALGMLNQVKGKMTIPNVKFRAAVDPGFRTEILKKRSCVSPEG